MLGRHPVGDLHHLLVALTEDDLPAVPPGFPGHLLGRPLSIAPALHLPDSLPPPPPPQHPPPPFPPGFPGPLLGRPLSIEPAIHLPDRFLTNLPRGRDEDG